MSVRSTVLAAFEQVAKEQKSPLAPLNDQLPLVDSGLDSLGLAVVITRLEDELGVDPFSSGEIDFPVTFGEFVKSYESAA